VQKRKDVKERQLLFFFLVKCINNNIKAQQNKIQFIIDPSFKLIYLKFKFIFLSSIYLVGYDLDID